MWVLAQSVLPVLIPVVVAVVAAAAAAGERATGDNKEREKKLWYQHTEIHT